MNFQDYLFKRLRHGHCQLFSNINGNSIRNRRCEPNRRSIWTWNLVFMFLFMSGVLEIRLVNGDGPNCMQNTMGPTNLYQNGVMNPDYMWPHQGNQIHVPVVMDHAYSKRQLKRILGGFKEIEHKTCVKFHYTNNHTIGDNDHVYVTKQRQGCWSYIGRIGGRQEMSLPRGCISHRTAVHEMIHALGFAHEHVRSDRDNYITVNWGNIMPGRERNFVKRKTKSTDPYGPYDYGSIMHYDRKAFSFNSKDTITPKQHDARIGVDQQMSTWDQKKINRMYQCNSIYTGGSGYGHGGYDYSNDAGNDELSNLIDDGDVDTGSEGDSTDDYEDEGQTNAIAHGPQSHEDYDERLQHDDRSPLYHPSHQHQHAPPASENEEEADYDGYTDQPSRSNRQHRGHQDNRGRNRNYPTDTDINNGHHVTPYQENYHTIQDYHHTGSTEDEENEISQQESPTEPEYQQGYGSSDAAPSSIFPNEFSSSPEQFFEECFPFCSSR